MTSDYIETSFREKAIGLTITVLALFSAHAAAESPAPTGGLTDAAQEHRLRLDFDGKSFSGPGLERLLAAARESHFLLIGEEHGIAENPKLVAHLFEALVDDGYEKLVIEISPPMATILDAVARDDGRTHDHNRLEHGRQQHGSHESPRSRYQRAKASFTRQ